MILHCDCKTARGIYKGTAGVDYQNHKYGHGKRVHNPTKGDKPSYRCTICNNERGSK
jgi:hypothetical protein